MKINLAQTIIAITASLLIAYGFYSFHIYENNLLLSIGSFVFLTTALVMTIGISLELPRTSTNIRVVSGIFFAVALVINMIFTFIDYSIPAYVIFNGLLYLLYVLIVVLINKSKQ